MASPKAFQELPVLTAEDMRSALRDCFDPEVENLIWLTLGSAFYDVSVELLMPMLAGLSASASQSRYDPYDPAMSGHGLVFEQVHNRLASISR